MVLGKAIGFAREHAARKVRRQAPGEQPQGLLGNGFTAPRVGRRTQGFRQEYERALMLKTGRAGRGKRLDQEQVSERGIGSEQFEAGKQSIRETDSPSGLGHCGDLDGGSEPLHPVLIRSRKASLLATEMLVESGTGESREFDDVGDLRVLVTVISEGSGETIEYPPALVFDHLGPREP